MRQNIYQQVCGLIRLRRIFRRNMGAKHTANEQINTQGAAFIFPLLGAVIAASVILTISSSIQRSDTRISSSSTKQVPQAITAITESVIEKSTWNGPIIAVIQRGDTSFTYAYIEDARVVDGKYVGDISLRYANGVHGIVSLIAINGC